MNLGPISLEIYNTTTKTMHYTVEIYRVTDEEPVFTAEYDTIEEACQGREVLLGGQYPYPVGGMVTKS